MKSHSLKSAFTLFELMIVVAILAIIASIVIPKLMSARIVENEEIAIATMQSILSAEEAVQLSAAIDRDADGVGEFAYFSELFGKEDSGLLDSSKFLSFDNGIIQRNGYNFQIFLPGPENYVAGKTGYYTSSGIAKNVDILPDPQTSEQCWCAYAWPVSNGKTGNRTFFASNANLLLNTRNKSYDGDRGPSFDAVLSSSGDMMVPLKVGGDSSDGGIWTINTVSKDELDE